MHNCSLVFMPGSSCCDRSDDTTGAKDESPHASSILFYPCRTPGQAQYGGGPDPGLLLRDDDPASFQNVFGV
jgi:hypothetical protein